jgi:hypothetical protein
MNSLVDSLMTMNLDVYIQENIQDETTGAIKKEWSYSRTVPCSAKGMISNSATARGSDRQAMGTKYTNEQIIQLRTSTQITYREKITNIRDSSGNVIWKELNWPIETPTVFEVVSSTPVTDPFGNVLAFNSIVQRSENQQIGL